MRDQSRGARGSISPPYRADVYALVAYVLLAIVLTYPLVLHLATHVAGDGSDDPALAWNLWWVPYSILQLNSSPIYTHYMFYPLGLNLAFYTLTYLNAFIAIPLQFALNLVIAANANLLLSFALGGFGAYLLTRYLLRQLPAADYPAPFSGEWAAFAAGALYAFSSNKFLYASLGQFNIASSHWIPFYVLFLLKLANTWDSAGTRRRMRYGFMLGLFLLFQALSEFIFASFLLIFTAVYLVYWLVLHRRDWRSFLRLLPAWVLAALVFVIPMLPILTAMIQDMLTEGDFIQSGLGFADVFSTDVLGFFVPGHLHPLLGGLESQFHFAYTNFGYLGFVALALAVVALWKIPPARGWGLFAAIFILITLGPELRVNGTAIAAPFLPFNWLLEIPIVKGNRYPSRWGVMVTLCLAVMVGYGIAWLLRQAGARNARHALRTTDYGLRFTPYVLLFILYFLLLFEHLSVLPLSNFKIPDVYKTIAQDRGDFTVLEIPLAWRNGFRMTGTLDQAMMFAQWYQTEHRHPLLGGNTSRNPELKFQYFTETPVINSLIAVETGHTLDPARIQADRKLADTVLRSFGVRYVVWHTPRRPENAVALNAARAYVEQVFPVTKFYDAVDETGETVAYRIAENAVALTPAIQADAPWARLNFGEGWGTVGAASVWATRQQAKLFLPMDESTLFKRTLAFRANSPLARQTVRLEVNGRPAGAVEMQPGWGEYRLRMPENIWRVGMNEIVLRFDSLAPVRSVREGEFAIGATGINSPVSLVATSAGNEVGDFAHVFVNGIDAAPNAVGYNVVVLDPQSGAVEASAAFNPFASAAESERLAQFINEIPNGKIVVVTARDEVSRYLTASAVDALETIGAQQDLRGKWRWSHALIGVKGAPPGSALESAGETIPAQVVVGLGATEPNVAAALEWLRVQ